MTSGSARARCACSRAWSTCSETWWLRWSRRPPSGRAASRIATPSPRKERPMHFRFTPRWRRAMMVGNAWGFFMRLLHLSQIAALLLGVASLAPTVAFAGESSPADKETSRALYAQGVKALQASDFAEAERACGGAYRLVTAPTGAVCWAKALEGLGKYVEARDAYLAAAHYPSRADEARRVHVGARRRASERRPAREADRDDCPRRLGCEGTVRHFAWRLTALRFASRHGSPASKGEPWSSRRARRLARVQDGACRGRCGGRSRATHQRAAPAAAARRGCRRGAGAVVPDRVLLNLNGRHGTATPP